MHEISLMRVILETVEQEMAKCNASALNRLTLRIGTLTAVEPDAMRFAFDAAIEKTPMEGATLDIMASALSGRCRDCGTEFPLVEFDSPCPICSGVDIKRLTGTELDIVSIDVD
ncbi:MAG: hydrogenase maturation nickel metallochaperone HypA [Proteobacteria bacterium]|nr:hydrogenase maturation nickel metallochaperone HypA [Pseudomonadota bacterium]